ncbi:MAG: hypothetical protein LBD67_04820 [Candidatus Accumulibacter sp.]|jgi:hypothetical protein|nr:hypothetical protein [Accumulibacter sp.]
MGEQVIKLLENIVFIDERFVGEFDGKFTVWGRRYRATAWNRIVYSFQLQIQAAVAHGFEMDEARPCFFDTQAFPSHNPLRLDVLPARSARHRRPCLWAREQTTGRGCQLSKGSDDRRE